jgi:hypothetical protein
MTRETLPYHVVDLTPGRRLWLNILDLPRPTHSMYGLLEVDVTVARQCIAEHKARTGETLSFTGFLAYCLARAVDEDKTVQAYPRGHTQLVLFDDVNVGLMVERPIGETRALTGHVIRGANHKTYLEIHHEIRSAQSTPVPPSSEMPAWFRSAMLLPWPLSRLVKAVLGMATRRDPTIPVSMAGTVGITAVGMFAKSLFEKSVRPLTGSGKLGGMSRQIYKTDLSDKHWKVLEAVVPQPSRRGRPREHSLREIVNAIL